MIKRAEIVRRKLKLLPKVFITILLFVGWQYVWFWIHEFSHWSVCQLEGYGGQIIFTEFVVPSEVKCYGIEVGTPCAKFLVGIAPYTFDMLIVVVFNALLPKRVVFRPIPYIAALDSGTNFVFALYKQTDFRAIFQFPLTLQLVALFILIITLPGTWIYFTRNDMQTVRNLISDP